MRQNLCGNIFGNVQNYVEPFAGSLAVLLARPHEPKTETVNDADCYIVNFWRAISQDPEGVAFYADWPVTEADQNARHLWLVNRAEFRERMNHDPDFYDSKIAGWWCYGQNIWIGDGWCNSKWWGTGSNGINRKLPHLGDAGKGINRQLPHLGNAGTGIDDWFQFLCARLKRVRICCGDWTRILTPSVTEKHGLTGILLDPPYLNPANQDYAVPVSGNLTQEVVEWAKANGDNPLYRIALCGYEGDYEIADWTVRAWVARKGYQADPNAAKKERIWFSPHCLTTDLFNRNQSMALELVS